MTVGPNPVPQVVPAPGTKIYLKRTQTLNNKPAPGDVEHGELWMNYHSGSPRLYFKDNANQIVEIKPGAASGEGANPPLSGNETGDLWFDGDNLLVWNGASWQVVGVSTLAALDDTDVAGATANQLLAYDGNKWVAVSAASIAVDVNLGYTPSATQGVVTNDAGSDATIPARTDANAGLMLPADKTAIDGLPADFDFLRAGDNVSDLNNDAGYITAGDIPAGVENLDDLGDVNVATAQSGQILKYNGVSWNAANPAAADISGSELNDLGDVNVPSPQADQHLAWSGTEWVAVDPPAEFSGSYNDLTDKPAIPEKTSDLTNDGNGTGNPFATTDQLFSGDYGDLSNTPTIPGALNDLSDVNAGSPSADQVLQWNGTAWVPGDVEAGGGLQDTVYTGLTWVNAIPTSNQVAGGPDLSNAAAKTWATRTSFVTHLSKPLTQILAGQTLTVKNVTQNQTAEYTVTGVDEGFNAVEVSYISDTGGDIRAGNEFELTFGFPEGAGVGSVTSVGAGDGLRVANGGDNPITSSGTLEVVAANATITVTAGGIAVTPDQYMPLDGGVLGGSLTSPEQTITSIAFDLSKGPFWLVETAIDVPNPTNAVAGMSGLIRFEAPPNSWGFSFKFPGGTPVQPSALPAVAPFYVKAADEIYIGTAVEELI